MYWQYLNLKYLKCEYNFEDSTCKNYMKLFLQFLDWEIIYLLYKNSKLGIYRFNIPTFWLHINNLEESKYAEFYSFT